MVYVRYTISVVEIDINVIKTTNSRRPQICSNRPLC